MGEVVGKAASICIQKNTSPRGVYQQHLEELINLMKLPGAARRETVQTAIQLPEKPMVFPLSAGDSGRVGVDGVALEKVKPGLVVDDTKALLEGKWTEADSLKGYLGKGYRYAGLKSEATALYSFTVPKAGKYEVRVAWQPHPNRASNTACTVECNGSLTEHTLNQKEAPTLPLGFTKVTDITTAAANSPVTVGLSCAGANGHVHADAVWLFPVP
jgi:hypothetical protein